MTRTPEEIEEVAQAIWAWKASEDVSWNQVADSVKESYRAIAIQVIPIVHKAQLAHRPERVCPGWQGEECWYDEKLKRYVVTGWDSNETCPICKGTGKAQPDRVCPDKEKE